MYKTGMLCSSFDLLHPGHIRVIQLAQQQCEKLILALNCHPEEESFGKNKPVQTIYERWSQLNALKGNIVIIPYENDKDLILLLKTVDYDVRFLGKDYKGKSHVGKDYERMNNIPTVYFDRSHGLSTSELRNRICCAKEGKH